MATNQDDLLERIRRQQTLARIRAAQGERGTTTEERRDSARNVPEAPARAQPRQPREGPSPLTRTRVDSLPDVRYQPGQDPHLTPEQNTRELQAAAEEQRGGVLQRIGRGARAAFRFPKTVYEALTKDEEEVPPEERPPERPSEPEDYLTTFDRVLLDIGEGVQELPSQIGKGLSEVGHRTALGVTELVGADQASANIRASRELSREVYGEAETVTGQAGEILAQLAGEGALFLAPGAGASRILRAGGQGARGGRFLQLLASPQGFTQRAVQNFLTGAPIDIVLSQASAEDSMAGAMAVLTGNEELETISQDPLARAVFDVITGFGLGEVFGETLHAAGQARARPRARNLGVEAARAAHEGAERPDLVAAIEALPEDLRQHALQGVADETDRLQQAAAGADAELAEEVARVRAEAAEGAPAQERRSVRRRISDFIDPSRRREDVVRRQALEQSFVDEKTGLRNADAFETARARIDANPDTEVLLIDARNLHALNKAMGHEAGDQGLRDIADAMRTLEIEDRSLFRIGGDEFALEVPKGTGRGLGELLTGRVGEQAIEGTDFSFGVRYGVGDTFGAADEAMQRAAAAETGPKARPVDVARETPEGARAAAPAEEPVVRPEPEAEAPRAEVEGEAPRLEEEPTPQDRVRATEGAEPAERTPEGVERQEAAEAPAREPSELEPPPVEARTRENPAQSVEATSRGSIAEIAKRELAKPVARTVAGAAVGTAIGTESEEISPAQGALIGAAAAAGLPGVMRLAARTGQAGHLVNPGAPLQGRYFSKATTALDDPRAPESATGEAWMGFLKKQGVSQDELESIRFHLEVGEGNSAARVRVSNAVEGVQSGRIEASDEAKDAINRYWSRLQATRGVEHPNDTLDKFLQDVESPELRGEIRGILGSDAGEPTFTKDEVADLVQKRGIQSRITETMRSGEAAELDEDRVLELEGDLQHEQQIIADIEARIQDYDAGGTMYEDASLELLSSVRTWVDEVFDELEEAAGDEVLDLSRRELEELTFELYEEAEALAHQGYSGDDVMTDLMDTIEDRWNVGGIFSGLEEAGTNPDFDNVVRSVDRYQELQVEFDRLVEQRRVSEDEAYSLQQQIDDIREGEESAGPLHEQYTMPGGDDYHELLIRIDQETNRFRETSHFPENGIFAFLRNKYRQLRDGLRSLHIEELQSDLHQTGRKFGYESGKLPAGWEFRDVDIAQDAEWMARYLHSKRVNEGMTTRGAGGVPDDVRVAEIEAAIRKGDPIHDLDMNDWARAIVDPKGRARFFAPDDDALRKIFVKRAPNLAPDVPFQSTGSWVTLALKRALWQAADEGMDFLTWASGAQAAANYNPARFGITRIEYDPGAERLWAWKGDEMVAAGERYPREAAHRSLRDAVGSEIERKLFEQPMEVRTEIDWSRGRPEDLKPGGHRRSIEGTAPDGTEILAHVRDTRLELKEEAGNIFRWKGEGNLEDVSGIVELESDGWWAYRIYVGDMLIDQRRQIATQGDARIGLESELKRLYPNERLTPEGYTLQTTPPGGGGISNSYTDFDRFQAALDRLTENPESKGRHALDFPEGFQLDGHGHKAFYDGIVLAQVKKYLRQLGFEGNLEAVTLDGARAVVDDEYIEISGKRPIGSLNPNSVEQLRNFEVAAREGVETASGQDDYTLLKAIKAFQENFFDRGLSGEEAVARAIEAQGLFWTDEIDQVWRDWFPAELRAFEAYEPPPTNLGIRITPELRDKILFEGQRLGYLHPALVRPLGGAAVGAALGGAFSDELEVNPVLGAMIGAVVGTGFGSVGRRGGRTAPTASSRRAAETFNMAASPRDTQPRALAPAAQGGDRLREAGKFFDNPEAKPAEIVSPVQIVEDLGRAVDQAFREEGLGLGVKTGVGGLTRSSTMRGALGEFKARSQVVRQIDISDVPVFGHEAGHAMHKLFFGATPKGALSNVHLQGLGPSVDGELRALGKGVSDQDLAEGWAEFWRRYVDNPRSLEREAPKLLELVEARLEGFPELKNAWLNARSDWQRYRESDPASRVWSKISVGDRETEVLSLEDKWSRIRTSIIDDMEPVRRLVQMIRDEVGPTKWEEQADDLARLVRGSVGSGIHFLEHGTVDFATNRVTGKGLKQVLAPVMENVDDFRTYIVAKRAQELHGRDILTGLRNEDVDLVVERMEATHGDTFTKAFDEVQDWNRSLLKYLRDSGVLSKESYDAILELNQSYVPFYRVVEGGTAGGSLGETYGHLFSPVKRIKGSGRDIIDPLESMSKNALTYTQIAQKQQVSRALAKLAEREGVGTVLERLGNPIQRTKFKLGEIEKQLEEVLPGAKEVLDDARAEAKRAFEEATAGMDEDEIAAAGITLEDPAEEILAVFRPGDYLGRRNTISVLVDGKRQWYEVNDELYNALEGLNKEQLDAWARWVGLPARTLRAGATLAPEFAIRNPARDQVMAFVQSEYGYLPGVDMARGVFELARRGDLYQEWIRSGGYRAALTSLDRKSMQAAVRSLVEEGGVRNVLKHPFDALQALSALMEDATRIGEFRNAQRQLAAFGEARGLRGRLSLLGRNVDTSGLTKGQMQLAGGASREISTDFARHGAKTAAIRHLAAFWNARLQGYDRMFRAAKRDPAGFATKAFAAITLPSLLEYYSNMDDPDYWEQPQWKRDLFWLIKNDSTGEFWAIPKPFELGVIFGTIPVRIVDAMRGGPGGEHELVSALEELVAGELGASVPVPTAALPIVENYVDYSFFLRRPITPRSQQELSQDLQTGPYTSEAAQMLSRWTHDAPVVQDFIGSPRDIDNLLFGWTGGLGRLAAEATNPLLQGRVPFVQPPEVPPIGRTLTDFPGLRGIYEPPAGFSSESIERFYERYSQARTAQADLDNLEGSTDSERYQEEVANDEANRLRAELPGLRDTAGQIAALRRDLDAIRRDPNIPPDEKRRRADELGLEARQIAASILGRDLPEGGG